MTIQTFPLVPDSSIATNFRNWGTAISAMVGTAGLAKTKLDGFGNAAVLGRYTGASQMPFTNAVTATILIPLAVQVGDLMIFQVTLGNLAGTAPTATTPSGWTSQGSVTGVGTNSVVQYLFTKVAASGDVGGTTQVVSTLSVTVNSVMMGFAAYYANTGAVNVYGSASSGSNGTTATSAAVTTTLANGRVVEFWGGQSTSQFTLTPAATALYNLSGLSFTSIGASEQLQVSPGATSAQTATLGVTGSWAVQTIALVPSIAQTFPTPTTSTNTTGGTLTAGTYTYRLSATNVQGETLPCAEFSQTVPAGTSTNTVTINWTQVAKATGYKLYGRLSGATSPFELLLTSIASPNGSVLTFLDTGALVASGALNTVDTTSDTGQIAWEAIVAPTAATRSGFEIFQFTDTIQATTPIFIRLDYGAGQNSAIPQMWLTVGTKTDGSGNITSAAAFPGTNTIVTGNTSALAALASTWGANGNPAPMWVDSDGGSSMMIAGWFGYGQGVPATSGFFGLVERSREWDGTANAEGVMVVWQQGGTTCTSHCFAISNAASFTNPAAMTTTVPAVTSRGLVPASALAGTTAYASPVFTGFTPRMGGPSKHVVGVYSGDLPTNNQFAITHYGATRTFLMMGSASSGWPDTAKCGAFRIIA